jgi:hypothetical protein
MTMRLHSPSLLTATRRAGVRRRRLVSLHSTLLTLHSDYFFPRLKILLLSDADP